MNDVRHYSDYIRCLHDEAQPQGRIGHETHFSIFRSTTWHDALGARVEVPRIHDFAVIWDEDHDERVVGVIERMYFMGLLHPVVFIGERKGMLIVVLSELYADAISEKELSVYESSVSKILQNVPTDDDTDTWGSDFHVFKEVSQGVPEGLGRSYLAIVPDHDSRKVETYLRNIHNLWGLGHKNYTFPKSMIPEPKKPGESPFSRQAKLELPVRRSIFPEKNTSY